jgi:hypothetical protein
MRRSPRVADVSINTVSKLLVCIELHDELVRNVKVSRVHSGESC